MQSKLAKLLDPLYRWITNYMGDCGFILYGIGKDDPPPPPDYAAAARETAQGNIDAARVATAANRVNQITPFGNLTYKQTGTDSYGNPTWTATQELAPAQQRIAEQQAGLSSGLLGTAQKGLDYAGSLLEKPGIDISKLPSTGFDPGQSYQDAIMKRLAPQLDRENQSFEQDMANKGIGVGTQAYNTAKSLLAQNQNDRLTSATVQGINTGLTANQQAFNQAGYNQMQPINVINALRTGSQVSTPNYVNPALQSTTQGPDLLGAVSNQYNAQLGATNAANANTANFVSGLMNLGGSIYGAKG
ncbi:hypothetical protein UFOVP770_16 [uncultured Caudovirales phage]|uniref:Tail fiber domain-containing protein n=1 Tax=uncultured Caudovirales phage TaxID=2100421 RepID=A0A6J5NN99_9CAUD|nr:hypothetical protein UFOVP770_16 [uncultured Caudovirales phage]